MSKKIKIIPIFVPHQGCVNDCVFCNQKKITGLSTSMTKEQVIFIIERNLKTMSDDCQKQIAFYGGSFTAIDLTIQKELLAVAKSYKDSKRIDKIKLSTRPDYINRHILDILKENRVDIIELGVQSLDEEVLRLSNRGHSIKHVYDAVKLIREYKFTLGLQMMIGLAGDNEEKCIKTAKEFIKLKPDIVRIYPTLVLKETLLADMLSSGEYQPVNLEEAVRISAKLLMMFTFNGINVIRVGLQPTDNITEGNDVLAGPFHPAFRQLTESYIYRLIIDESFAENDIKDTESISVEISSKQISNFVGNKKTNINHITKVFRINKVNIMANNELKQEIKVYIKDEIIDIDIKKYTKKYLKENGLI
ncbi:radical SAM protein [Clostridiaceae bacterium M8S5]|nr:radical SAM protein [Clostridiaceae bacterium M8S5]